MKMHLTTAEAGCTINACGKNFVVIDGEQYKQSLLLLPGGVILLPLPEGVEELADTHLSAAVGYGYQTAENQVASSASVAGTEKFGVPEVFLLGAGEHSPIWRAEWLAPFAGVGVSLEVMSLSAACRTYNIMQADGRAAAAILLMKTGGQD